MVLALKAGRVGRRQPFFPSSLRRGVSKGPPGISRRAFVILGSAQLFFIGGYHIFAAMKKDTSLIFKSEFFWLLITLLIFSAVLWPIYSRNPQFPFLYANAAFILVFITFTRYIFLLKQTPLRYAQWAKVVVFLVCIPLVFYLIQEMHAFQVFADETGVQSLFMNLTDKDQSKMIEYTKTEMTFFGVGSIIATVIMPFRMLISFWRTHNHGTT